VDSATVAFAFLCYLL